MSLNIWTQCGGKSSLRAYRGDVFRVVEAQHVISTRKLTDTDEEQELLESLIDRQKPPLPRRPEFDGLHYLLFTPFRHPPLRHGSRFGIRAERGIWYGAQALRAAFAEVAYYRLLFLEGTAADLSPLSVELSAFKASIHSDRSVDLTSKPFVRHADAISSPTEYAAAQALGGAMRSDGVALFVYRSARDVKGGANVGLFSPTAFSKKQPHSFQTWHCVASKTRVELARKDFLKKQRFQFPRTHFEVDGVLPAPAV